MKKWFSFFLLLVTLAGTFYPCCLEDECSEEEVTNNGADNKRQGEGACSPFFACATCNGFATMYPQISIPHPVAGTQVHHEKLVSFNLATFSSSFWQPPRCS